MGISSVVGVPFRVLPQGSEVPPRGSQGATPIFCLRFLSSNRSGNRSPAARLSCNKGGGALRSSTVSSHTHHPQSFLMKTSAVSPEVLSLVRRPASQRTGELLTP